MDILKPAIDAILLDSAIYNDVHGRCSYQISNSTDYPYLVYSCVSGITDNVFAKKGEEVLIQFDLYSMQSAGDQEILTMKKDLIALFDDCILTLIGNVLCKFQRQNVMPSVEDVSPLPDGTALANRIMIEYEVNYQAT